MDLFGDDNDEIIHDNVVGNNINMREDVAAFGGGFVGMGTRYDKAFDKILTERALEYEFLKPKVCIIEKVVDISNVSFQELPIDAIKKNIQQYQTVLQEYNDKKKEYDAFSEKINAIETMFEKYKDVNKETHNMLNGYKQYVPIPNTYNIAYMSILDELRQKKYVIQQSLDSLQALKKKGFDVIAAVHNVCNESNVKDADLKHPCSVCMSAEVDSCLPCGHTFCNSCIVQTERSTRQKKCSACRVSYQRAIKLYLN